MIFVTYMEDGFYISKELGLQFYHAKNPITAEERCQRYQEWVDGKRLGIVCTTALAAGNDYPHVWVTAHLGSPYDMVTFLQQSG